MEIQNENHIFVAIGKRLKEVRKDGVPGPWYFIVMDNSLFIRELGTSKSIKALALDQNTDLITSFIANSEFSKRIIFSEIEMALSTNEKLELIANYLRENYMDYAMIGPRKLRDSE